MKSAKIEIPKDIEKQIYLDNRSKLIEEFRDTLASERNEFTTRATFICILSQEDFIEYVTKVPHQFASVKDEKEVLNLFVKEAKAFYGKDYEKIYQEMKKGRSK